MGVKRSLKKLNKLLSHFQGLQKIDEIMYAIGKYYPNISSDVLYDDRENKLFGAEPVMVHFTNFLEQPTTLFFYRKIDEEDQKKPDFYLPVENKQQKPILQSSENLNYIVNNVFLHLKNDKAITIDKKEFSSINEVAKMELEIIDLIFGKLLRYNVKNLLDLVGDFSHMIIS